MHTLCSRNLVSLIAAMALSVGVASATEQHEGETATITCAEWDTRYTSDPAVGHAEEKSGHDPIILERRGNKIEELVLPALPGVFAPDTFDDQGATSTRVMGVGPDSLVYRLIGHKWSDTLTFIRLDTDTPQVNWQRLRYSDDGGAYETFYVGNCTKS